VGKADGLVGSSSTMGMTPAFSPEARVLRSSRRQSCRCTHWHEAVMIRALLKHRVHLRDDVGPNKSMEILPAVGQWTLTVQCQSNMAP
jgi:hypothetical protein